MRKVKVISKTRENPRENPPVYTTRVLSEGLFHRWFAKCQEFDNGAGNYTVTIIELADGTVVTANPESVQFEIKDENNSK